MSTKGSSSTWPPSTAPSPRYLIVGALIVLFVVLMTNIQQNWIKNKPQSAGRTLLAPLTNSLSTAAGLPEFQSEPHSQKHAQEAQSVAHGQPSAETDRSMKQRDKGKFCDGTSTCIFDIGHNTGQDTRNYLSQSSTTRVLAVDANPVLMQRSASTFSEHIASGRLLLVTTGLIDRTVETDAKHVIEDGEGLTFWVNTVTDRFSSFKENTGCRDLNGVFQRPGNHTYCKPITVPTRSCADLVREYGTPNYMKVDIEGLDNACVASLADLEDSVEKPKYVSIENVNSVKVRLLVGLGYNRFKAVVQNEFDKNGFKDVWSGHSGPWGEKACDYLGCGRWVSEKEMIDRIPLPGVTVRPGGKGRRWYDLHAKRDDGR